MSFLTIFFIIIFVIGLVGATCVLVLHAVAMRAQKDGNDDVVWGGDSGRVVLSDQNTLDNVDDLHKAFQEHTSVFVEKARSHIYAMHDKHTKKILSQAGTHLHGHAVKGVNHAHKLFSRMKYFLERREHHYPMNTDTEPSQFLRDMAPHKMTSKKPRVINTIETDSNHNEYREAKTRHEPLTAREEREIPEPVFAGGEGESKQVARKKRTSTRRKKTIETHTESESETLV